MIKIEYKTPYADDRINGYVMATDCGDYCTINKQQYKRATDNLTIAGVKPMFITDKWVRVIGIDL